MRAFLGRLRERVKWWVAPAEMAQLERLRVKLSTYRQWLGEFPDVATTLENFSVDAWCLVPTLNAGTPAPGGKDGPWTVQTLREVLRARRFDVGRLPGRIVHPFIEKCSARAQGTSGGNTPADCDWPFCGCDPHADRVIAALQESGGLPVRHVAPWPGVAAARESVAAHYRKGDARVFMRMSGMCTAPPGESCFWPECGCDQRNKACGQDLMMRPKPPVRRNAELSPHATELNPRCALWPGCTCAWNQPCINLPPAPAAS